MPAVGKLPKEKKQGLLFRGGKGYSIHLEERQDDCFVHFGVFKTTNKFLIKSQSISWAQIKPHALPVVIIILSIDSIY